MTSNQALTATSLTAPIQGSRPKNTYSLKRWDAFEAWQARARASMGEAGARLAGQPDRDLRRSVVRG